MDTSTSTLVVGFVVSTIGFSLFLFGKKQARPPQLVAGLAMMALPFVVTDALWMAVTTAALVGATWFTVRSGY